MLRKTVRTMALLSAMLVVGCVPPANREPTQIQGIEDDQFSQAVTIKGAMLYANPYGEPYREWFIRSFVEKKTGKVEHQLYFMTKYIPPRSNFLFAADNTATALPVTKIFSHKLCPQSDCLEEEDIGVTLRDAVLRAHAISGYQVKVSARDGTAYILDVTPTMLRLQFAAIDQVLLQLGLAPANEAPTATATPTPTPPPELAQPEATAPNFGVQVAPLPPDHRAVKRDPKLRGKGVVITAITPNSPAFLAALAVGDVIVAYDGKPVASEAGLNAAVAAGGTGRKIPVEILFLPPGTNVGRITIWISM